MAARPSREEMFMQVAHVVAQRSTCLRAQVGCIITNMDGTSIKSMGYNGNARGLPDICDDITPGACGCLHAEENALLKAPYGEELRLYTTYSPCMACSKRILNSSVGVVIYDQAYRDLSGPEMLIEQGIRVIKLDGMSWWMIQLQEAQKNAVDISKENRLAKQVISCLMHDLQPEWKPGENAAARAWGEREIQRVLDSRVHIGLGPMPLSIKVEVR